MVFQVIPCISVYSSESFFLQMNSRLWSKAPLSFRTSHSSSTAISCNCISAVMASATSPMQNSPSFCTLVSAVAMWLEPACCAVCGPVLDKKKKMWRMLCKRLAASSLKYKVPAHVSCWCYIYDTVCVQDYHEEHALQAFCQKDENRSGFISALDFYNIMTLLKGHLLTDFVKENLVGVSWCIGGKRKSPSCSLWEIVSKYAKRQVHVHRYHPVCIRSATCNWFINLRSIDWLMLLNMSISLLFSRNDVSSPVPHFFKLASGLSCSQHLCHVVRMRQWCHLVVHKSL